jgi:uncharacterized protein YkwD
VGILIQKGIIGSHTLVRFGEETRWYAASSFILLRQFLKQAPFDRRSSHKNIATAGLLALVLVFTVIYLSSARRPANRYPVLASGERQVVSSSDGPRLSTGGIVQYTNRARAENGGLPPLTENSLLDSIASERADDMLRKQYFAHFSPSGEGATDVAQRTGYHYKHLGENIAMGYFQNDEKVVKGWMQSPGHRKNILADDCSEIGAAVRRGTMRGQDVWVAVQIFGEQSPAIQRAEYAVEHTGLQGPAGSGRTRITCRAPDESLLEAITKAKADMSDVAERAGSIYKEISAYKSGGASNVNQREVNQKILNYNELVHDINSRKEATERLVSDYNRSVEIYNACIKN